jgi:hypothetical protein
MQEGERAGLAGRGCTTKRFATVRHDCLTDLVTCDSVVSEVVKGGQKTKNRTERFVLERIGDRVRVTDKVGVGVARGETLWPGGCSFLALLWRR